MQLLRTERTFWPVPLTMAVDSEYLDRIMFPRKSVMRSPDCLAHSATSASASQPRAPRHPLLPRDSGTQRPAHYRLASQLRAPPSAASLGLLVRLLRLRFEDLPNQVYELVRPRHLAGCAGDLPTTPANSLVTFAVTVPVAEHTQDPWSAVSSMRTRTKLAKDAFTACEGLAQVTLPPTLTEIASGHGPSGAFSSCTSLTTITLPACLTKLGGNAFSWCSSLATVTLPSSLAEIGEGVFRGCSSLTEIALPPALVKIESDTFSGCSSLAGIALPPALTEIRTFAFQGCTSLTEITVPATTHLVRLVARDWVGHGISVDNIPGLGTFITKVSAKSVANISGKVRPGMRILTINGIDQTTTTKKDCAALLKTEKRVEFILDEFGGNIPRSDLAIPPALTEIGSGSFQGCVSLTNVTLLSPVLTQIGAAAFLDCTSLTEITLPPALVEIEYRAFFQCTSLTKITLPDSLVKVGAGAFSFCTSLAEITLPASLTEIGWGGFEGCTSLATIALPPGPVTIAHDAFRGCPGTPRRTNPVAPSA